MNECSQSNDKLFVKDSLLDLVDHIIYELKFEGQFIFINESMNVQSNLKCLANIFQKTPDINNIELKPCNDSVKSIVVCSQSRVSQCSPQVVNDLTTEIHDKSDFYNITLHPPNNETTILFDVNTELRVACTNGYISTTTFDNIKITCLSNGSWDLTQLKNEIICKRNYSSLKLLNLIEIEIFSQQKKTKSNFMFK
jgi:hypothetical protein